MSLFYAYAMAVLVQMDRPPPAPGPWELYERADQTERLSTFPRYAPASSVFRFDPALHVMVDAPIFIEFPDGGSFELDVDRLPRKRKR